MWTAYITSDFTCVNCAVTGTIFGTTDVYELGFPYLSISIFIFIFLGISIICLSLHIIASFLTAELQNLSGKNLLSLSCGLWGGYVTFVAAMFSNNMANTSYCKTLATLMYFCFMASFCWMMIIGNNGFVT